MRQASRANRKVDEANELTKEVRPSSGRAKKRENMWDVHVARSSL